MICGFVDKKYVVVKNRNENFEGIILSEGLVFFNEWYNFFREDKNKFEFVRLIISYWNLYLLILYFDM